MGWIRASRWLGVVIASLSALSQSYSAIMDTDTRIEAKDHSIGREFSSGTASMVSYTYISENKEGKISLEFPSYKDEYALCEDVPFASQPISPIACTGFLVAPDLLLTAGHCAINTGEISNTKNSYCESFAWLFDHRYDEAGELDLTNTDSDRLYRCKEIVYAIHEANYLGNGFYTFKQDFALIRLDRKTAGRKIFDIQSSPIGLGRNLAMIGYPSGLPAKMALGQVLGNANPNFLRTDLDATGGNSGSPVLTTDTEELVGLLVRSFPENDLVTDKKKNCERMNICRKDAKGSYNCLDPVATPKQAVGSEVQIFTENFISKFEQALAKGDSNK